MSASSLHSAHVNTRANHPARGVERLHVVGRPGGPVVGDVRAPSPCSHPGSASTLVSPSARQAAHPSVRRVAAPLGDASGRAGDTWWCSVPQDVRIALVVLPPFVAVLWLAYAVLAAGGAR